MSLVHPSFTTKFLLLGFVFGLLVTGGVGTSCLASDLDGPLVGQACTAERLTPSTIWSQNTSEPAILVQKLSFTMAPTLILLTPLFILAKNNIRGLTWFNRRLNFARGGPAPNSQFLPYLFATHGW